MKKVSLSIMVLLFSLVVTSAFATDAIYERNRVREVVGWSVFGADDDIGTSPELITELDTTYAQLAAEDTLEVLSADSGDSTQTVTVIGIGDDGNKLSESFILTADTAVAGALTFRYVDQVSVDAECAGAITVRRATGDTFITSIPIGSLEATMVQHFNGEETSYITGWRANNTSTTGTLIVDLRVYPDDADCLDAGDGFRIEDQIVFTNVLGTQNRPLPQAIKVPAGSWIAVYCTGGTDNADVSATIQGYDVLQ